MPAELVVQTGARLHFGLLAHGAEIPRRFGGAGVMVSGCGFRLRGTISDTDDVRGDEATARRVGEFVSTIRTTWAPSVSLPPCRIDVEQAIPPHAGLGSGTQLGLAVARLVTSLAGQTDLSAVKLAQLAGRGLRSGLGVHGFGQGGFLVDGGKRDANSVAPLVSRLEFPAAWRFVLIIPREHNGLSGAAEKAAFSDMAGMPVATTEHLCRLLLLQMLPAVAEADFAACSDAIYEYGRVVGEYFAPYQGGVYSSALARELVPQLREQGYTGVGQSSWGPTLFVLCPSEAAAAELCGTLQREARCPNCDVLTAAPLNHGATCG